MAKRNRRAVLGMLSVVGLSAIVFSTASAEEDKLELITIPYEQEDAWKEVAMVNDDTVETGVNIRATADEEGEVVGYLYRGAAAWVIKQGEEWTEICSGEITGFVKNECLLFDRDVIGLADHYGLEGVATTWDDVKLFAQGDGGSEVLELLETGRYFPLVEDGGHWLTVQSDADSVAYLSEDDVTRVLILDTAVDKDGEYRTHAEYFGRDLEYTEHEEQAEEQPAEEPSYEEQAPSYEEPSYQPPQTEWQPPQTEAPQTEAPQTEAPQTEAPQTEAPQTEAPQTEAPQTEAPQTEAPDDVYVDEDGDDSVTMDDGDGGWYDADTDTYYDANGNVISGADYNMDYTETEAAPAETEAAPAETESAAAGTDDASLLAALIYCEAGNQSYEGMVAVGAVVMNRVNSDSFPNTVSEVIYQGGQFTPASSGSLDSALANGVPSTCYDAANAALAGENPVGGALYFNTGSGKGTQIGDHQFY